MLSVSSWVWTRVAVSISYDDNHYTTGTSNIYIYTQETTNTKALYTEHVVKALNTK